MSNCYVTFCIQDAINKLTHWRPVAWESPSHL